MVKGNSKRVVFLMQKKERRMKMKLITKEIEKQFEKYPLYSQDGKGKDAKVLVKIFNPYGVGTWLITEASKDENGDWLGFGWADLGYGWECGYISIKELEDITIDVFGCPMKLERDMYSKGTVKELMD